MIEPSRSAEEEIRKLRSEPTKANSYPFCGLKEIGDAAYV